ncbi:MAG: hypothetical protein ACYTFV_11955 [Planctomycetota bacterium]
MSDSTPPKLRPLGISTPLDGSEGAVRLSDPLGLRPQGPGPDIDIPPAEWAILRRFDGERGSSEIAEAATDELGRSVSVAEVDQLVTRASDLLLLEDQTYERALDRAFDEFRRQAIRPAVGPGRDYEQNGFDLRVRIGRACGPRPRRSAWPVPSTRAPGRPYAIAARPSTAWS